MQRSPVCKKSEIEKSCLLLSDSGQDNYEQNNDYLNNIFNIMCVGFDKVGIAKQNFLDINKYKTAVIDLFYLDAPADVDIKLSKLFPGEKAETETAVKYRLKF